MTVELTIGMPIKNEALFIERALTSLLNQDFCDWTLIISDNCSTDGTIAIVNDFVKRDERIKLIQHPVDIGVRENFLTLAAAATTPYFMWAAGDDEWSENYISSCLAVLKREGEVGFVSGHIVNTNLLGESVRTYRGFPNFEVSNKLIRLSQFLASREIDGKANLFYGIFRTLLLQEICESANILKGWGADVALVAAALTRARYRQSQSAVLYKRLDNEAEVSNQKLVAAGHYAKIQFKGYYPLSVHAEYVQALCDAITPWWLKCFVRFKMGQQRAFRLLKLSAAKVIRISRNWVDFLKRKIR